MTNYSSSPQILAFFDTKATLFLLLAYFLNIQNCDKNIF